MKWLSSTLLAAALTAAPAWAQLDRGSFTGTVTDSTSAVIPRVSVTVQNANTGAVYQTTTSEGGQYTVPNLPVGTYDLTFEAQGFSKSVQRGVQLSVAEVRRIDASLEVGAVTQSIEVTAQPSRIQTDAPDVSTTLVGQSMTDLPLSIGSGGRVMEDLVYKLVPGATGSSWHAQFVGSTYFSNESLLEGATVTTEMQGYFAEMSISTEAVQEFKVQTSATSAEFGKTQGAVLNYVLKSGTNEWHGTGYGLLRNEALNANGFANNYYGRKRAPDRRWDYALSFGGPVTIPKVYNGRNKTFFYAAVEQYREKNLVTGAPNGTWPIPAFYEGDFSRLLGPATSYKDALGNPVLKGAIYDPNSFYQLPDGRWMGEMFPGNRIPKARFSKVAQNLNAMAQRDYLPTLIGPDGQIPLQNNVILPSSNVYDRRQLQYSVKVDENISAYHKLAGSLAVNHRPRKQGTGGMWNANLPTGGPLSGEILQDLNSPFGRIAHDWTISPTKLNHFLIYFNRFSNFMDNVYSKVDGAAALGIPNYHTPGYPLFQWGGGPFYSLAQPGNGTLYDIAVNSYGLTDTFNFSHGSHFMKIGFDGFQIRYNNLGSFAPSLNFNALSTSIPNQSFSGNQTGYSFASYLLGIVYSASNTPPVRVTDLTSTYALFFQDDYKITKRLSLNLGVRWDYTSAINEAHHRLSGWTPELTDPISGLPGAYAFDGNCSQCQGGKYLGKGWAGGLAPRLGFAFRLFPNTSLRGAYGIFYQGNGNTNQGWSTSIRTAWASSWLLSPDPVSPWRGIFNLDGGLPAERFVAPRFDLSYGNTSTPTMFDPKYPTLPYIQRWNFNIQHAIRPTLVLDIGYLGLKGTALRGDTLALLNQLPPSYLQQFGTALVNPVQSAADAAKNGIAYPYAGFRGTVASALRPYPQIVGNSTISVIGAPLGFSTTHQLQVALDKRFSSGLTGYVNYVWSKTLTNVESGYNGALTPLDYYNLKLEKALATYDIPHNFKAYVAYQLPVGRGRALLGGSSKLVDALVGGWAISTILNYASGTPLGLGGASSPMPSGWNGGSRINAGPGEMLKSGFDKSAFTLVNTSSPSNTYLNKSVFSDIRPLTLGTAAPRYAQARGFGVINEDLGLQKRFRLREKYGIQIRAEFLNVFNRSTLGSPNTNVQNALFGQITSISGNRTVQLGGRLDF